MKFFQNSVWENKFIQIRRLERDYYDKRKS